jgi:hypothetical protein
LLVVGSPKLSRVESSLTRRYVGSPLSPCKARQGVTWRQGGPENGEWKEGGRERGGKEGWCWESALASAADTMVEPPPSTHPDAEGRRMKLANSRQIRSDPFEPAGSCPVLAGGDSTAGLWGR